MNETGKLQSLTPRHAACPACGFANPVEFRFCGGCGAAQERGAARPHPAAERPLPERRQLTVLFCDLVGSTHLANRLDPEELREVIRSYQAVCTSAIRSYDGTVSRYMGDGILALFGYPRAHEDDAERAVRAGLEIIAAMPTLPLPGGGDETQPLAVRIGVATGLVVVGDIIGEGAAEEEAVVGETPNLAARLQSVASSNALVISAGTRALIGERFECVDLGAHVLKGFADPVPAWQVLASRFAGSRFEAAQPARISALVDRTEDMSWLLRLWEDAENCRGRVVLLAGEAGIGKSRLVRALRERIAGAHNSTLSYQCSPHYVNTALHPLTERIERAAGIEREDTHAVKLEKFLKWLGPDPNISEAVPLIGALLSIPPDARFPMPAMSPQRQKERTFELILLYMQRLAQSQPLLIVFEDVHWVDPTTQELLALLIDRVRGMRALGVVTFRADFSPTWCDQPHVERRELRRLAPEDTLELAKQVAGVGALPRTIIEQVAVKTDGVPLFVEELTRAVIGARLQSELDERDTLREPLPELAIPSTLQDSLMARLDQLGPPKLIAQIAGAIGREFSYELLESVVDLPPERLREDLQALQRAGLIYAERRDGTVRYAFKHALVQEVAYQSMLRSRRRELHLRIAEALVSRFPQTAHDAPELVAYHWTEAGDAERAVAGWLTAGLRASERSEHREAIGHLRKGLALVPRLADAEARRERELALLLALGPALITTEGGGTPEVGTLYARALELCEGTPESAPHFAAHWGWWRASMDLRTGRERADRMFALASNLDKPALTLQAHHCQWATLYMLGAHEECCNHIDVGLQLYNPEQHHADAAIYGGHDARVCALGERALARWMLGHPNEALKDVQSALDWASELHHVGSRAHALDYALVLHKFRRDADAVAACAGELIAFASEQQLRDHRAKGEFFQGWARAMLQDVGGGLREMLRGMAAFKGVSTPEDVSVYYEMLAEVYAKSGQYDEALHAIKDAFEQTERCGILFWNPELYRRRGELLLATGGRADAAAASFQAALDCARSQGASSLELRSAMSLARLHRKAGETTLAATVLRPVCERFANVDTMDAVEARTLLGTLR